MSRAANHSTELRSRKRFDAHTLNAQLSKVGLFGKIKNPHKVDILNLSLSGIAICTPLKLKFNRPFLLNLECSDHRLTALPVVVIRRDDAQSTNDSNVYALKFTLGTLPENARSLAYTLLQLIEDRLNSPANAA